MRGLTPRRGFIYGICVGIPVGIGLLFAGLYLYYELERALSPTIWLRLQVIEKSYYLVTTNLFPPKRGW